MGIRLSGPLAVAFAALAALALPAVALGAPGDVLADLVPAAGTGGRSVAFDGTHVYYTDLAGVVLHRVAPDGSGHAQVPIVGAAGIATLAYDATRGAFWGVDATGLSVFLIERDGTASRYFTINPATQLAGLCDRTGGCSTTVTGLAYDAGDDTLWYAPEGTQRVYHFDTIGHVLGSFDTNETWSTFFPDCLSNGVGGIAAGRDSLYLVGSACSRVFRFTKSDSNSASRITSFAAPAVGADLACDDASFANDTVWVRDAAGGHIRALEIASNSCVGGGGVAMNPHGIWFTGGGTTPERPLNFGEFPVHHGFILWCERAVPNRLHISWTDPVDGQHHTFQLVGVSQRECLETDVIEDPPPAGADTIRGSGFGRLDGSSCSSSGGGGGCATVTWDLIDGGEGQDTPDAPVCAPRLPEMDAVTYTVTGVSPRTGETELLQVTCALDGNVQAHGNA